MPILEGIKSAANIHPLFVHFPIALLFASTGLFYLSFFIKNNEIISTAKWCLLLGTLAGIITAVTGVMAEKTLPHNQDIHDAMEIHEKIMLSTIFIAAALSIFLLYKKDIEKVRRDIIFLIGLFIMTSLLGIGADYGAKMVFKYGAGTELFLRFRQLEDSFNQDDSGKNLEFFGSEIDVPGTNKEGDNNGNVAVPHEHSHEEGNKH